MNADRNTAVVKDLYARFLKGDVDGILNALADDVVWTKDPHPAIPYAGARKGKAAVRDFFTGLGQVEVEKFEVKDTVAAGDRVVALGHWAGKVKATGKRFESAWAMDWTLADGKVVRYRSYEDHAPVAAAFQR